MEIIFRNLWKIKPDDCEKQMAPYIKSSENPYSVEQIDYRNASRSEIAVSAERRGI